MTKEQIQLIKEIENIKKIKAKYPTDLTEKDGVKLFKKFFPDHKTFTQFDIDQLMKYAFKNISLEEIYETLIWRIIKK